MIIDNILRFLRERKIKNLIPKDSIICDLGCGIEPHLLKKMEPFVKKGLGFDKEILPYKNFKIELQPLDLEKEKIPLGNTSVNVVIMAAVMEHIFNPENAIKEVFRILKSGGVFIATTPAPKAKLVLDFLAFRLKIINRNYILDHKNYFSIENIKKILLQGGFQEKNIKINYFEFGLNTFILAKK